jgi:flagellar basal-body rod modification protein FlgD
MIEGITGIPTPQEESPYTKKSDELGRDNFLQLFMAQLKHQDPFNPMDSQEFTAQLAQFSSLEQLLKANENLESIKSFQDQNARSQVLEFIGKEIIADGDVLSIAEGRRTAGSFTLDRPAECSVLILDASGGLVRSIPLGTLEAGEHRFEWDGRGRDGQMQKPGTYGFQIMAISESGEQVQVESRIIGLVSSVSFEGGSPTLFLGKIPVPLSQVRDIMTPEGSIGQNEDEVTGSSVVEGSG